MSDYVKVIATFCILILIAALAGSIIAFSFNQLSDWAHLGWKALEPKDGIGIFLTSIFLALWAKLLHWIVFILILNPDKREEAKKE